MGFLNFFKLSQRITFYSAVIIYNLFSSIVFNISFYFPIYIYVPIYITVSNSKVGILFYFILFSMPFYKDN